MEQIPALAVIKNSGYIVVFTLFSTFLGFDPHAGSILITLMMIDVLTGVVRSAVVHGLPSIQSSIGIRGLMAKILTLVGLISLALSFKGIGYDAQQAVQGITSVFILAEAYSIIGNVHSSMTGKPKAEYDALAFIIGLVRKLLDAATKKTII